MLATVSRYDSDAPSPESWNTALPTASDVLTTPAGITSSAPDITAVPKLPSAAVGDR